MVTALILVVVLVVLIAGMVLSLRTSAKTGMPSKEIMEKAAQRARELESKERADGSDD